MEKVDCEVSTAIYLMLLGFKMIGWVDRFQNGFPTGNLHINNVEND